MKNCLYCKHCYITFGDQGYSEYTPGGPGSAQCYKGKWDIEYYNENIERTLAECLEKGYTCPYFESDEK